MALLADVPIICTDSHVLEPPDLWTSRVSRRWGDAVPHVAWDQRTACDRWIIGGHVMTPPTFFSTAGWREHLPSYPPTFAETDPASFDPVERLKRLDEYGVYAQVLYPNLVAFFTFAFMEMDPQLGVECVRAYNDFLSEFASVDRDRLVPLMMLPFWDVEESVREIERSKENGHKGILFAAIFERVALPNLPDEHWHPILDAAQSAELSLNFHVGFSSTSADQIDVMINAAAQPRNYLAETSVLGFLANARALSFLTLHGVCHRFPKLKFVSVESGFGWIPFVLQGFDWQFENSGVFLDHPEWLRPSEYFRRQVFGSFWFERPSPDLLTEFQDNVLFETDFPHPTSLSPGPNSSSLLPSEMVARNLADVAPDVLRKVLHDNAAALYKLR